MSGFKRQAAFQGGKDGFQPNWDQDASQPEGEKPQRASAAQLAQRKWVRCLVFVARLFARECLHPSIENVDGTTRINWFLHQ
jgi:hypothetical protein